MVYDPAVEYPETAELLSRLDVCTRSLVSFDALGAAQVLFGDTAVVHSRFSQIASYTVDLSNVFRVTDVWTSRAQFDEFVQNTIGPIAQQLGIPDPHPVNVVQVANFLTAGS